MNQFFVGVRRSYTQAAAWEPHLEISSLLGGTVREESLTKTVKACVSLDGGPVVELSQVNGEPEMTIEGR